MIKMTFSLALKTGEVFSLKVVLFLIASLSFLGEATAHPPSNATSTYDFIIIGGGTAGLAVASRISQGLPSSHILVLEAGLDGRTDPGIFIPGRKGSTIGTKYDWNLTTTPQPGISNRKISMTRGKVLGGSSALNLFTWDRGSVADYDAWEKLGNKGWNWRSMLRAMLKAENFAPSDEYGSKGVGHGGPIQALINRILPEHQKTYMPTVESLGVPANNESLGGNPIGVMRQPSNIRREDYQRSYSPAYLALASSNLVVRTDTTVQKINFEGKRATGITLANGTVINASKEVILSAGSLLSPAILELSGIGQRALLEAQGIEVIKDLPGVGENLQDHIRIQTSYKLKPEYTGYDRLRYNTTFAAEQLALYNAKQPSWYDYTGSGYAFLPWSLVPSSVKPDQPFTSLALSDGNQSSPVDRMKLSYLQDDSVPQLEVIFSDGYTGVKGYPTPNSTLYGSEFFTLIAAVQHPFSKGSIHITSPSVSVPPIINPNYLSNAYDLAAITTAAKYTRLLASTPPLSDIWTEAYEPIGELDLTDDEWVAFVRGTMLSIYHPVGTCAMLPEGDGGVVDGELKVHGVRGLRVVDASVMPILPSAHIQTGVYGVAERGAEMIVREWEGAFS